MPTAVSTCAICARRNAPTDISFAVMQKAKRGSPVSPITAYVQVAGWNGALTAEAITGVVVHSDLPIAGELQSDNFIVQQLWRNTLWSQRNNFVGVPTDCPQRDERLGWTGDAQFFWLTAAFNMDVRGFTLRFLANMRAS